MSLPEKLLTRHRLEHFRLHIIEQVYEKFKGNLWAKDSESKDLKIQEASSHFMELAKGEGNDLIRKNLYALIGFLKSETLSFRNYLEE